MGLSLAQGWLRGGLSPDRLVLVDPFAGDAAKAFADEHQVRLLKSDNVVSPGALTLTDLGITGNSVEAEVPSYLWRYRAKGEYALLADAAKFKA